MTAAPTDQLDDYVWIVVLGAFASFFAAFGIGANDVANAFATSVGSRALTVKQACALATIFEFLGATFLGGSVVKTIRKGIARTDAFEEDPAILMWGCLCVIFAVGFWLILATKYEMPVSTTHSCVGGMLGMAFAYKGNEAVWWVKSTDEFPFVSGFAGVVISWFLSPIASGIAAFLLFFLVRTFVLRSGNPFERSVRVYPVATAFCIAIVTLFMLMKGIKSSSEVRELDMGAKVGISVAVGIGVTIMLIPLFIVLRKRVLAKRMQPKSAVQSDDASFLEDQKAQPKDCGDVPDINAEATKDTCAPALHQGVVDVEVAREPGQVAECAAHGAAPPAPTSKLGMFIKAAGASLNSDPHECVGVDKATTEVHDNAEKFDEDAEEFFKYLQIFTACFGAFAHGANDVANAIGPFATIYVVYSTGTVSSRADMGDNKYWILGLGGIGICAGLLLYGYKIIRAIGVKLAVITASRGFCIQMGSSLIVIIGSYFGWPLSTTHCQVGATTGVALLEGKRGVNVWMLAKIALGWVVTCFFVGLTAGLFFAVGAYGPSVHARPPAIEACQALLNITA